MVDETKRAKVGLAPPERAGGEGECGAFPQYTTRNALENLCKGKDLSRAESKALFSKIVRGEMGQAEIAAVLVALKAKGEAPDEIAGAAEALLEGATAIDTGGMDVADTCGTGGDGAGTLNVSTAAAIVIAEAGIPVAKHGNRSVSSSCGSADVLEKCGVKIDMSPSDAVRSLKSAGICFLFAPLFHPGMKHAMPVRKALGVRTIFNVLGPLVNPARPRWQVVGVYDRRLCVPVARTLDLLGCGSALVVHGDGLDEVALHGDTSVAILKNGVVTGETITPEMIGFPRLHAGALKGGSADENAARMKLMLSGRGENEFALAVAINAGALLWIAGTAADLKNGAEIAMEIIKSGRAGGRLEKWIGGSP